MSETHVGLWAVNGEGRIAKITERISRNGQTLYAGHGVDGLQWATICPQILKEAEQTMLNTVVR